MRRVEPPTWLRAAPQWAPAVEPAAIAALEMFWSLLGAYAGDVALTHVGRGGVFLTGGMLPQLPAGLGRASFRGAFENKGRMAALVARVPVQLVVSKDVGILGAHAQLAALLQLKRDC